MRRSLFIISLLIPFGSTVAGVQRYAASEHESSWNTSSSRLYCSLSHEIPIYGRVVFERAAGEELQMSVEVKQKPLNVGSARVLSLAPSWKHDARERDLGKVSYVMAQTPFKLDQALARRFLAELEKGMFPTLSYKDWSDGRDEVQVSLSSVNLHRALGEFFDCLTSQLPYSFDYVRESRIAFGFDSSELSATAKQRLDEVAEYMLEDRDVGRITLEGRTDNVGYRRYNEALAKRRSEAVRNYLIEKGIEPSRLQISSKLYGERNPIASNRSSQGRALNRTVEVTLSK